MSHYLQSQVFASPVRLTNEQMENPNLVLLEYFQSYYHLQDIRHLLWQIVETCLTCEDDVFDDSGERANLLTFYEKTEELMEAVFLIANRAQNS